MNVSALLLAGLIDKQKGEDATFYVLTPTGARIAESLKALLQTIEEVFP